MAYNIYTPMQAPVIPASIFSGAAERGTKSAQFMDTPETARLKGEMLGKTKSLEMQAQRENIESANIQQERQREALKADKQSNKMAPIKDALGIAGSVVGLATGVQNVMFNANEMKMQQDRMQLEAIKHETEMQTSGIVQQTAVLTAQNNLSAATQANEDITAFRGISGALASGDVQAVLQLGQDAKTQSYLLKNPALSSQVDSFLYGKGAIDDSEYQRRLASRNEQHHMRNQQALMQMEMTAKKKVMEGLQTNYNAYMDSELPDVVSRFGDKDRAYDMNYLDSIDFIPADLFGAKTVDGKQFIDRASAPPDGVNTKMGGHYLIDRKTDRILTTVDEKGADFSKILSRLQRSNHAYNTENEDILRQGGLSRREDGSVAPTVDTPIAGKLPDASLHAAKARLSTNRVPETVQTRAYEEGLAAGRQASGNLLSNVGETAKSALNKVLPGMIDNVSPEAIKEADTVAQGMAEETLRVYREASPGKKQAMLDNIKETLKSIPVSKRPNPPKKLRDHISRTDTSGDPKEALLRAHYFGSDDASALKEIYKEQNISDLEKIREEGVGTAKRTATAAANERRAIAESAANPLEAARAVEDYERLRAASPERNEDGATVGLSGGEASGGAGSGGPTASLRVNAGTIKNVVSDLQNNYGWSPQKSANVEAIVNTVQTNHYLIEQPPHVKALAAVESAGKLGQVSPTGVPGLMQVTAAVEREFAHLGLDRRVPEDNVKLGQLYIDKMIARFGDRALAYAAYNGGPTTISDAVQLAGGRKDWKAVKPFIMESLKAQHAKGRLPVDPYSKFVELVNYPEKVMEFEMVFEQLT